MSETNKGKDWSEVDFSDLKAAAKQGITLEGAAVLLGRDLLEVARKAEELRLNCRWQPGSFHLGNVVQATAYLDASAGAFYGANATVRSVTFSRLPP